MFSLCLFGLLFYILCLPSVRHLFLFGTASLLTATVNNLTGASRSVACSQPANLIMTYSRGQTETLRIRQSALVKAFSPRCTIKACETETWWGLCSHSISSQTSLGNKHNHRRCWCSCNSDMSTSDTGGLWWWLCWICHSFRLAPGFPDWVNYRGAFVVTSTNESHHFVSPLSLSGFPQNTSRAIGNISLKATRRHAWHSFELGGNV